MTPGQGEHLCLDSGNRWRGERSCILPLYSVFMIIPNGGHSVDFVNCKMQQCLGEIFQIPQCDVQYISRLVSWHVNIPTSLPIHFFCHAVDSAAIVLNRRLLLLTESESEPHMEQHLENSPVTCIVIQASFVFFACSFFLSFFSSLNLYNLHKNSL